MQILGFQIGFSEIVVIASGIWAIFSWWWAYHLSKERQKQTIEIEELKSRLEKYKTQFIQNDSKIRWIYESFINTLFDLTSNPKNIGNLEGKMRDFMKTTMLFAGPKTIWAFWDFVKISNNPNKTNTELFTAVDNLILAMREDLWVENANLQQFQVLQIFIKENIQEVLNKENIY